MILGTWETILVIIISLGNFFLGLVVFLKNSKKQKYRFFFYFSLSIILWIISAYVSEFFPLTNPSLSLLFSKIAVSSSLLSATFIFFFILTYFYEIFPVLKKDIFKIIFYISFFIFLLFLFTSFGIKNIFIHLDGSFDLIYGPLYYFCFFPYIIFLLGFCLFIILKGYKKLSAQEKKQLQYFLVGIGIFALFSIVFNIIFPLLTGSDIYYRFGNYSSIFFVGFTAYAIIAKQLFGVRVILTDLLVGVMGILLLIQVFLAPTLTWRISSLAIFLFFCFLGHQLINYSHEEEKKREEAEKLAIRERALRKKAEKVANEYKRLDETKTMFLNLASHQLRTPLSSMKGYLELALSGNYGKVQGKAREFIEEVKRSNEKEINLVNDLLDLNKLQTGKLQFSFQDNVQLEDIIQEVVNEFQPEAQKYNLYLKFNKPKHPLPKITADSQKLREVILNLVDNALKYTKEGGVTISVQHNNNSRTILTIVQDTGMGMTPKEKEKLFQVFERSKDAVSTNPSGVGIGLYFASEIVKAHNGKIWAESQGKGKGSTFYVELPVK